MRLSTHIIRTALVSIGLSIAAVFPVAANKVQIYRPCAIYYYVSNGSIIGGFSTDRYATPVLASSWGTHIGPNMTILLVAINLTCDQDTPMD
jgi:hypothetical protein